MSLSDRARAARERADATGDPGDIGLADALESAEAAAAREQMRELLPEPPDPDNFPPPPVSHIRLPRGGIEN